MRGLLCFVVVVISCQVPAAYKENIDYDEFNQEYSCVKRSEFEISEKFDKEYAKMKKKCGDIADNHVCHMEQMKKHCAELMERIVKKCPSFSVEKCEVLNQNRVYFAAVGSLFERNCSEKCEGSEQVCEECKTKQVVQARELVLGE